MRVQIATEIEKRQQRAKQNKTESANAQVASLEAVLHVLSAIRSAK